MEISNSFGNQGSNSSHLKQNGHLENGNTLCEVHCLPIIIDDNIRKRKFCRQCLMGFCESDERKGDHRTLLERTIISIKKECNNLKELVENEMVNVNKQLETNLKNVDFAFYQMLKDIHQQRELLKKSIKMQAIKISEGVQNSFNSIQSLLERIQGIQQSLRAPLSSRPLDLSELEQEMHSIKTSHGREHTSFLHLQTMGSETKFLNNYNKAQLTSLLCSMFTLEFPLSSTLPEEASPTQDAPPLIKDTVSEQYDPVLIKLVFNTKQVDCYQILKNQFSTFTISEVISPKYDAFFSSFSIPKNSKSIITHDNRIFLLNGCFSSSSNISPDKSIDKMYSTTTPRGSTAVNTQPLFPSAFIYELQLHSLRLIKRRELRMDRFHAAALFFNGFIYVTGGTRDGKSAENFVERYDVNAQSSIVLAAMVCRRYCHAMCGFQQSLIYAVFGQGSSRKGLASIERYDVICDRWSLIKLALSGVARVRGLKFNGIAQISSCEILVFGGGDADTSNFYSSSYIIDLRDNIVKKAPKLKNATIFRNQTLTFDQKVYAFGVDNNIHIFDIQTRKWFLEFDRLS
jgi:hypothetical protein